MKSGALSVDEFPSKDYKDKLDSEAAYIGLQSKYQADCVRTYLWKRLMFIDPVSNIVFVVVVFLYRGILKDMYILNFSIVYMKYFLKNYVQFMCVF